jgi:AbrB family looped-hinge helix DNA binding protein
MFYTATVTSKGQITIPIEIREELNLVSGQKINFISQDNQVFN